MFVYRVAQKSLCVRCNAFIELCLQSNTMYLMLSNVHNVKYTCCIYVLQKRLHVLSHEDDEIIVLSIIYR
jgi:hypothetical protein